MNLAQRARAFGRKSSTRSYVAALQHVVPSAPPLLASVEVEVDELGAAFPVSIDPGLGTASPAAFWRQLEQQVARFLAPGDRREAELVATIVRKLPWQPRKHAILRLLETRAFGATPVEPGRRARAPQRGDASGAWTLPRP